MTELTRRRDSKRPDCWHVYYGDVQAGVIATRPGVPVDVDQWGWQCGFYPPSHSGRHIEDTAASLDQARAGFEVAWERYLQQCTEADFEEYRRQRAFTSWSMRCTTRGSRCQRNLPTAGRDVSVALQSIYRALPRTFTLRT